ncbi:hypothetical protein GC177_07355 [bacterium]|nr:hypothetical protein [bacterium]
MSNADNITAKQDAAPGFGRGRSALGTFLGGFTGAAIFGTIRKIMQTRVAQEKELDQHRPLPQASEEQVRQSGVLRYRDAAEKLIPGFDRKTANEYGEFAGFFAFMTGATVLKPLYDRLLGKRDDAYEKRGPVAAAKGGLSWLAHYVIRFPVAAAAALVPYALMGKFLDENLYTGPKEIPADANLAEHAALSAHNAVQTPFGKMFSRVAIMFSTFNVSHRALSRTVDKVIGPAPGKAEEPKPPRNIFANAFKELYDTTFGTIVPVMISVTPLVSTLFFTNDTQKKAFQQRLSAKLQRVEEANALDHVAGLGFKAGEALNQGVKRVYDTVMPEQARAKLMEKGLNIGEQEAIAAYALATGLAYASYAATRTDAVEPAVKKTFAVGKVLAPHADAQLAASHDAPVTEQAVH